jgi:hypothetical protein
MIPSVDFEEVDIVDSSCAAGAVWWNLVDDGWNHWMVVV